MTSRKLQRGAHVFVAAVVDVVRAEDFVVFVAEEDVVAVPLVDAEVFVEVAGDGVTREFFPSPCGVSA